MKQQTIKKQWDELSDEGKMKFILSLEKKPEQIQHDYEHYKSKSGWWSYSWETIKREVNNFRPSIGQMIEFLGDYWADDYQVDMSDHGCPAEVPPNDLLCDRLWEAVKNKLKQDVNKY